MKKTTLSLTSEFDGYNLAADFYQIDNPLALVVIFGGMMEHKERYQNFAEFLTNQNYAVLVCDHRGHGETAETLGYFGKRLGWLNNLVDLKKIIEVAALTYPKVKKYLVAHSMGTLFARAYLKRYPNDFEKYVLSGTPANNPLVKAALNLAKLDKIIKGEKTPNPALHKLVVLAFNKAIKNPKTDYDWLSYNKSNVEDYIKDPLCGFVFTTSGFIDLFEVTIDAYSKRDWGKSKLNPTILFISGDDDPCSSPDQFAAAITHLKDRGYKNVKGIRYPKMRHEIFHEDLKETIFQDIFEFFSS